MRGKFQLSSKVTWGVTKSFALVPVAIALFKLRITSAGATFSLMEVDV